MWYIHCYAHSIGPEIRSPLSTGSGDLNFFDELGGSDGTIGGWSQFEVDAICRVDYGRDR